MSPARYLALLIAAMVSGCGGTGTQVVLNAERTSLHLEDHLEAATVTGSEVPANPPQAVEWRFDAPQPEWRATPAHNRPYDTVDVEMTGEGLRVTLTDRTRISDGRLRGAIHVGVPDWHRGDWVDVLIRARADSGSAWRRLSPIHSLQLFKLGRSRSVTAAPATN